MKTDQLVAALVADRRQSVGPPGRSIVYAIAVGSAVSLVIFALAFGPRVDLAAAFATWRFDLKLVLVCTALLVLGVALLVLLRLLLPDGWGTSQPERRAPAAPPHLHSSRSLSSCSLSSSAPKEPARYDYRVVKVPSVPRKAPQWPRRAL